MEVLDMLPISVCLIAKNEEKYIGECLSRLARFHWEIVVVDTGSTDRTVEIARTYTPCVYHFDWINDFSAAKNYAVQKASYDYILTVDCDEYLESDGINDAFLQKMVQQISPMQAGMVHRISPDADLSESRGADTSVPFVHESIARFFHRGYVHYVGSIHEQLAALNGSPLEFIPVPLTFYHAGYSTTAIKKEKASRNIAMLEAELQAGNADSYILFQLGQSYFGLSDYEHALPYFEQILSMDVNEKETYIQTMIESYGYCLLNLGFHAKALELEGIYDIFSQTADFVFLMGLIYMNNAMFQRAIDEFLKATSIDVCAVDGVNSYKAYYNVGVIYECMGDAQAAIMYYKKCEGYGPARERLAGLKSTIPPQAMGQQTSSAASGGALTHAAVAKSPHK